MSDILETRLEEIEKKVFGPDKFSKSSFLEKPALDFLDEYAKNLGNSLEKRERIHPILRRVDDLQNYLDPKFGENRGIATSVKAELILAQEERIQKTIKDFDVLNEVKGVLDKASIMEDALVGVQDKIAKLTKIQIDQESKTDEICEETMLLVEKYNSLIQTISTSFVEYDQIIKRLENKK